MHKEAYDYVFQNFFQLQKGYTTSLANKDLKVLELGSFNINGGVRDFIEPWCQEYVGLDLQAGPGVDVVMSSHEYIRPNYFDFIVTTETFEHNEHWKDTLMVSWENLVPNGVFIATMAGEGRAPHSALDEKPIRDWEYYANIVEWDLRWSLKKAGFQENSINTSKINTDIRCTAVK